MRKRGSGAGVIAVSMLVALCSTACPESAGDGAGQTPAPIGASFSRDVAPILTRACGGCHAPGGFADRSGIPLNLSAPSIAALVQQPSVQAPDRALVVPFDASLSYLVEKIESPRPQVGERMPLFRAPLSSAEIAIIRDWIDAGAAND